METTKRTKSKPAPKASAEMITTSYRDFVLTEGRQPASVFKFCKDLGITEDAFYQLFASFDALEKNSWKGYIETTRQRLQSDDSYASLSAREKILTFYFALAEVLKSDRSFVLMQLASWKNPALTPKFLKTFKLAFEDWIATAINDGKATGEIAKRPFLDKRYHQIFWLHLTFILQFWGKDESANFENTDAAIEKSVNLAFDLIGKGVLDNAIDFGKFLYQTARA